MELPKRDRYVAGEGKIPDLGIPAEFHCHVHEAPRIRACFAQPDMEDVSPVNNREEYMLDFHAFGERDICTGRHMGAIRIIYGKIAALAKQFKTFFNISLDHLYREIVV